MSDETGPAEVPAIEPGQEQQGTQYYWCVNCGNHGNFKRRRQRGVACEECKYDGLTPYELEEIMADEHLVFKFKDVLK